VIKMLNSFFDKFIFTNNLKYKHNNFYLVNLPFLIIPTELITSIAKAEDTEMNRDIYYAIKETTWKKLIQQFTFDPHLNPDKALTLLEEFFTAAGWGAIKNVDIDKAEKRAIVVIDNAPLPKSKNIPKLPLHHFLRGILAGIFSDYFKTEIDCLESDCISEGNPNCKFILKEEKDFDFSKKDVKMQLENNI